MNATPHSADADRAAMLERLNAYLDGELNADEMRLVEQRLVDDPVWAEELHRLERAWDLLDQLPRSEVTPEFTQTTVEMIAVDAAEEWARIERPPPRRRRLDMLLFLAGGTAAALAGFLLVDRLRPRRDDDLLRDLPVVRNVELYSRTDPGETVEFLLSLRREEALPTTTGERHGR